MSYERLIREHDEIDAAARQIEVAASAEMPDVPLIVDLLNGLACMVTDHLLHEDRTVYSRLLEIRKAKPAPSSVDFELLFEELCSDWRNYLAEWDAECITADLDGFRAETAGIMARLRDRVRTETELVYPLALQHGAIRLRDPPN